MKNLDDFLTDLRRLHTEKDVPNFDHNDGGIDAKVLFVLEAPGPKVRQTNRISRDNGDPTANNMKKFLERAQIAREDTLLWNIVPWIICNDKNITPNTEQIKRGTIHLLELIDILPNLRALVLVGKKAQKPLQAIRQGLAKTNRDIEIFTTYHPSPQHVRRSPENERNLQNEFNEIGQFIMRKHNQFRYTAER